MTKVKLMQDCKAGSKGDIVDLEGTELDIYTSEGLAETVSEESLEEKTEKTETNEGGEFVTTAKPGGLETGEHKGTIVDMKTKEVDVGKGQKATYLDIFIDVADADMNGSTRVGFPFNITVGSGLGKLLKRFGEEIEVDKEYNVKEILLEEPVNFYVAEDEEGYSNVKKDTIMPAE